MLDRPTVAEIAEAMGFEDAARWIRDHRDRYARAIFGGLEVDGEGDSATSPG